MVIEGTSNSISAAQFTRRYDDLGSQKLSETSDQHSTLKVFACLILVCHNSDFPRTSNLFPQFKALLSLSISIFIYHHKGFLKSRAPRQVMPTTWPDSATCRRIRGRNKERPRIRRLLCPPSSASNLLIHPYLVSQSLRALQSKDFLLQWQ